MDKIFRWLSGNKKNSSPPAQDMANTAPLSEQQIQAIVSNQNPRFDLQQLISSCGQSVGKQRELNEDSLLTITAMMAGNAGNLPFGLYIVADGMGGHQFGEVASNAAIRTVAGYILRKFHPYLFHIKSDTMDESFQEIMQAAVSEAQRAIQRDGLAESLDGLMVSIFCREQKPFERHGLRVRDGQLPDVRKRRGLQHAAGR